MKATIILAGALAALAMAGTAAAQTYGQPSYGPPRPVYGGGYGHGFAGPGTPLSELETQAYVRTGANADGYAHYGYGGFPSAYDYGRRDHGRQNYGHSDYRRRDHGYGRSGYGHSGHDRGGRYGYAEGGHRGDDRRQGYRDEWGYNDDRPASARGYGSDRRYRDSYRDCGCQDVYLYDR